MNKFLILALLFTGAAHAQAPHAFYDREAKTTLVLESAAWTSDITLTCRNLAAGGREVWLPARNCRGAVAVTLGYHLAAEGGAYLLHRAGLHKLERLPRWFVTSGNINGAIFTAHHGR